MERAPTPTPTHTPPTRNRTPTYAAGPHASTHTHTPKRTRKLGPDVKKLSHADKSDRKQRILRQQRRLELDFPEMMELINGDRRARLEKREAAKARSLAKAIPDTVRARGHGSVTHAHTCSYMLILYSYSTHTPILSYPLTPSHVPWR